MGNDNTTFLVLYEVLISSVLTWPKAEISLSLCIHWCSRHISLLYNKGTRSWHKYTHTIPAEPLKPQMNSRLQSHGAMYSLCNEREREKRERSDPAVIRYKWSPSSYYNILIIPLFTSRLKTRERGCKGGMRFRERERERKKEWKMWRWRGPC